MFSERVTRKMLSISVDKKDGGIMVVPHPKLGSHYFVALVPNEAIRSTSSSARSKNACSETAKKSPTIASPRSPG
jgi:hypothetical protein